MPEAAHRLHRGWREIKRGAIFAIVGAAIAFGGYAILTGGGVARILLGGAIALIGGFAVVVGFNGMLFEKVAACPACGKELAASGRAGAFAQCPYCSAFVETHDGSVSALPEQFIADEPRFLLHVPDKSIGPFRLPNLCAVCCAPSSRTEDEQVHDSKILKNAIGSAIGTAIGGALFGVTVVQSGGEADYMIRIPYCDRCTDGAIVRAALGGLDLRFRSLAFARIASETNQLKLELRRQSRGKRL